MEQSPSEAVWKPQDLGWLLEEFAARLPDVSPRVVLASRDGLSACTAGPLDDDQRDAFAAAASGLLALGRNAVTVLTPGRPERSPGQIVIQHPDGLVFIMAAGKGSILAVVTGADADAGRVGHEMAVLVQQVGLHLVTPDRARGQE
ncbi:roadblock/LC7 domain-containing protein [Streptomyces tsukubensis]|uniref:roadblock/LC7 domain-containing protein n=1 Tax=Streptomyces tsukubensis TaxID=83656 RepID=UPI00344B3CB6